MTDFQYGTSAFGPAVSPSGSDILIIWDFDTGYGDWNFLDGDIERGLTGFEDLQTAVLVSLFTDRYAGPDFVPPDGTGDLRGWWADTYRGVPLGSRLWTMYRSKKSSSTGPLLEAKGYCQEALQWLIDDGIAASVGVQTFWNTPNSLGINITITEPVSSASHAFNFSYAWAG